MTLTLPLPFRSSRHLEHGNPVLGQPCVVLDLVGLDLEPELYADWRRRVEHVSAALGWPVPSFVRTGEAGARHLGFSAPCDQLQTAREANEWALCSALLHRDPLHWSALRQSLRDVAVVDPTRPCVAAEIDECRALARLQRLGAAEARGLQPA